MNDHRPVVAVGDQLFLIWRDDFPETTLVAIIEDREEANRICYRLNHYKGRASFEKYWIDTWSLGYIDYPYGYKIPFEAEESHD